jgi:hypothetical protein
MRIREDHAFFGEAIHVRRGDLAFRIEAFYIAMTEIIAEDENDVRFVSGESGGGDE